MTDKISDEARELHKKFFGNHRDSKGVQERLVIIQSALTAARNRALAEMKPFVELAQMVVDSYSGDGDEQSTAQEARRLLDGLAMKVGK